MPLDGHPNRVDRSFDQDEPIIRERLSGAINAISMSPEGNAVVVAGREILKVLSFGKTRVVETLNLRAGSQLNLNYSSNDVKWGNNATKHKVATAATNGAIILWDLHKVGRKSERVITEHSRAVNRISFQPDNGNILLSASQDGLMKCWDFRDSRNSARYRFEGKSESVRDVQFNPVNIYEFAAAFETGTIQKWDIRNPKALYDRKLNAHNGPCLTVDWHSGGKLVASGGRDRTIKVWDMSTDNRRPLYTIRTVASVSRIQWRPGYEDEIASCALLTDNRIHIWDIRRPHIAKYVFDEHDTTPTALLYSEQERDVENEQLDVESIEEAKIKEERQHNEAQDRIDSYEQLSQSSGYTNSLNTTLSQTQVQFSPQTPWQHDATVMDLFNYYTEQGDVQMCVTLYLVLEKYLDIDENRLEDWFTAYIDLLHRFKLWSTATAIIKACKVQNVRERNENATTINVACNTCFKLVQGTSNGAWACDKCHRLLNPCTICHQTVKGLYVWCQGCNHGGHLAHMRGWFATEKLCATGCGHACVLQPLSL
ncbi:hypothetical protein RMCBS344292_08499 [Rhizopus microsporus]|nr:hypothetical protein RMCBS344292_08499 [Rhizopus microsporus]